MDNPAIRVEHVSKRYQLGSSQGYKTIRESIHKLARRTRDKSAEPKHEIWALDDVSFEVPKGELVGVIGRNGAGKTTILKVLSRITKPTSGRAQIQGRVGTLL